jgi:hypothetical protein
LDPAVSTGVAHTYFFRGEYQATIESYDVSPGYYLDAASWAALGETNRAATLLRKRLGAADLSPLMRGLMSSLLAAVENRVDEAARIMETTEVEHEPEVLFYTARHFGYLQMAQPALDRLEQALRGGYVSAAALTSDDCFRCTRKQPGYSFLLAKLRRAEDKARREFERANGARLLRLA